ncbi:hypothetical protein [Actibacterium ureilyticum]|uniref:hypothetical protein n=1 Tax=Actibacterium ureilyticum TaxID=1590614 RepID=UPI000BAAF247|nr:hypothetical protein [Actibacterium ureilyticum]
MADHDPDREIRRDARRWGLADSFLEAFISSFGGLLAYLAVGAVAVATIAVFFGITIKAALVLAMVALVAMAVLAAANS